MVYPGRRKWRLFYCLTCFLIAAMAFAQGPALTTISDTVFRADGSPASGTLLISWPAFTTADNHAVAAGTTSVALAANGSFSVQLAPNTGALPQGASYFVVYQLSDGTVKTETWSVGTASPETITQVRIGLGNLVAGSGPFATQSYVNSALANVVHLSGAETITGTKQFSVSPTVPTPSQAGQAANKAYVDASAVNNGSGNFVLKSGDTMTGSLTLPADPTTANQASTKHYVDVSNAGKADLVNGTVPVGELGTGAASNTVCLHGDSTWGGCGTGTGLTPGMQAIKYATDFAWTQTNNADLTSAGAKTLTLGSCPSGVSATEPQYYIYISGTGTAEAVLVTGGTCAGNSQPGTLQFTTANSHPAGYVIGSASSGLQEALVAARFTPSNPTGSSQSGKVIVPPGELKAFARVSIRASNVTVDFSGSIIECWMNDTCLFVGDPGSSTLFGDITLVNPRGRPTVAGGTQPFIEAHYRSQHGNDPFALTIGRAMARVTNPAGIAAEQRGIDDGVRAVVRHLDSPTARTSSDCENAALALLSDGETAACEGQYECWSQFLPGGALDIFPGDALNLNVPSRAANFQAIVDEVVLTLNDLAGENSKYEIHFVHNASEKLAFAFSTARLSVPINVDPIATTEVGTTTLPSLTSAAITAVSSTTASIDAGVAPLSGGGIEARWSDSGWGPNNDQNLAGRFTTQTFTLPRLSRVQNYFLRQFDASTPPKYSRHSAALHIDLPF